MFARAPSFERYAYPLGLILLALIALEVALANLPPNHVFAGHDSGFYVYYPHELIRTSAGTWEVKSDFGFPNFQAMVTLPYALLVTAINALHLGQTAVGRFFYGLELFLGLAGCYSLAWVVLRRAYPEKTTAVTFGAALVAAFAGGFNVFTAVLLMYPPSNFQTGIMTWPAVISCELYLLWFRPRLWVALCFYVLFILATIGNPATTMLGCALVAACYAANGFMTRSWLPKLAMFTGGLIVATLSYVWMPALASMFLYHGAVAAPEQVSPASLLRSQDLIAVRTSLSNLLRFDGLLWWPKTPAAELYGGFPLAFLGFVPVVLGIVALRNRRPLVVAAWALLLVGIWLAKSVHGPFGLNMMWLMTHIGFMAAFRETYDKFMLLAMIAVPVLAGSGFVMLASSGKRGRVVAGALAGCVALLAWPFVGGAVAEPYFSTTVPQDYATVNALMGDDPETRFLSLPGAPGEIHVTTWFKGGNFENLLDHAGYVNAAIFKERSISAAPFYDDDALEFSRELPSIVGLLGAYGINYIVLHKDYLTEYRMAFDFEPYQVLGPLTSRAMERVLDRDNRVAKVYEGPNVVLYRVRSFATLPRAYASYQADIQVGFENNLLASSESGMMSAAAHPVLLFTGNQVYPTSATEADRFNRILSHADGLVEAPIFQEDPDLYRDEITGPEPYVERWSEQYSAATPAAEYLFAQGHGDYLNGSIGVPANMTALFQVRRGASMTLRMSLRARRAPREILAQFFGSHGAAPWAVVPYDAPNQRVATRVPVKVFVDPTGVRYQLTFTQPGPAVEHVAAEQFVTADLADDPQVSMRYEYAPLDGAAAFLQLDFVGPDGHMARLDKPLPPEGRDLEFDVRDALQAVLDERYANVLGAHRFDEGWRASQPFINPEQADGFELKTVRLIMAGTPNATAAGRAMPHDFRLYSFQLALAEAFDSYRIRGFSRTFVAAGRLIEQRNVAFAKASARGDTWLVHARVTTRPLPLAAGTLHHSVTLQLHDNRTVTGDVVLQTRDSYLLRLLNGYQLVPRARVAGILSVRTPQIGTYEIRVPLPSVNVQRYPTLRVRYWVGDPNETATVVIGLRTPQGPREIVPSLDLQTQSGLDTTPPIFLNEANSMPRPTGWVQLSCDMRQVIAYETGSLAAVPTYLILRFSFVATTLDEASEYDFGFGDVAFFGEARESALPDARVGTVTLDAKPLQLVSVVPQDGQADETEASFAPTRVLPGIHSLVTRVQDPWMVTSAMLGAGRASPVNAYPQTTIRHIDDELYAVHVAKGARSAWLAFAETYHGGWRLIPGNAPHDRLSWLRSLAWLGQGIGTHVVGNAYDNTWYLAADAPENYVLDFEPQDFAVIGEIVAMGALAIAIVALALGWLRRW